MIGIISGYLLIAIAFLALTLQRLYSSVPSRELKRLAKRGDQLAKELYRPVAYGQSLRAFLWFVAGVCLSVGLLLALPHLPGVLGFLLLAAIMAFALVVVPSLRLTVRNAQFAAMVAPGVVKVMYYAHSPFDYAVQWISRYRDLPNHSRLYEKRDLQELLEKQEEQADNRMLQYELELARRALAFDDKHAEDIVQPRGAAHLVDADDTIGPLLLDKLHQSGQSSFLVYKDEKDNIIGSLTMRDAVAAKKGGRVFDLVHSDLTFVNEDFTLRQVLGAFQKTGHNVGVVINKFEEFVGVVTMDDVVRELVGEPAEHAVDNYEDKAAVAAYQPKQDEEESELSDEQRPEEDGQKDAGSSPETTEVVE
jgi:CBS domain containing-hemolysin-like protein